MATEVFWCSLLKYGGRSRAWTPTTKFFPDLKSFKNYIFNLSLCEQWWRLCLSYVMEMNTSKCTTEYEYTSILAACLIFAGWGFIQWNCYAKLSNQSGGSYSIENVCLLWTFSFWTEPHSVKTSMVGCISKFYFLSCSARSRILYEVEPLLHKTSYVLLPSEQRHVQINLTLALTLFFWLWTGFCPQIGQNWATSDSYSLLLLFRSFCYNEYFRKILFK